MGGAVVTDKRTVAALPLTVGERVRVAGRLHGIHGKLATVVQTYPTDGRPNLDPVVKIEIDNYPGGRMAIASHLLERVP